MTKKKYKYTPSNYGYFVSGLILSIIAVVLFVGMLGAGWNLSFAEKWNERYDFMVNLYVFIVVLCFFLGGLLIGEADLYEYSDTTNKNK